MNIYSEKVMDHFKNPRNMGEMKDADAVGEVGNPVCGDLMYIYIKVKEKDGKEILDDVSFQTFGCGAAIATSSIMTDMIIGKTLNEVRKITNQAVTEALGGLPPIKRHCSVLAEEALTKAIQDFEAKK